MYTQSPNTYSAASTIHVPRYSVDLLIVVCLWIPDKVTAHEISAEFIHVMR